MTAVSIESWRFWYVSGTGRLSRDGVLAILTMFTGILRTLGSSLRGGRAPGRRAGATRRALCEEGRMVESFGDALRRRRESAGLSQPQLARRVPISQASLSRYERGLQAVDPLIAGRLDDILVAGGSLLALLRAYRYLGRFSQAAALLEAGLSALPTEIRAAEWAGTYQADLDAVRAAL